MNYRTVLADGAAGGDMGEMWGKGKGGACDLLRGSDRGSPGDRAAADRAEKGTVLPSLCPHVIKEAIMRKNHG